MIKKLALSICVLLFFTHVNAQTTADSTIKNLPDSTLKHKLDTAIRHKTDTTAKPVAVVHPDSISKAIAVIQQTDSVKHSPLKTLTYAQYDALLKGEDLYNMSLVATLNHFPMPDEVVKYKKRIDLSPIQISKITAIANELHRKRVEMGGIIIKNEQTLDDLFKSGKLDEGSVIFYANRYGLYQGELRTAILVACYNTERLLSPAQIKHLESLENHK
jgi:hypothetical protein